MWKPCFGKRVIMHKYVGVYILVLMYNSYSMCHLGNIIEIKKSKKRKRYIPFFWNEMDANCLHMY